MELAHLPSVPPTATILVPDNGVEIGLQVCLVFGFGISRPLVQSSSPNLILYKLFLIVERPPKELSISTYLLMLANDCSYLFVLLQRRWSHLQSLDTRMPICFRVPSAL